MRAETVGKRELARKRARQRERETLIFTSVSYSSVVLIFTFHVQYHIICTCIRMNATEKREEKKTKSLRTWQQAYGYMYRHEKENDFIPLWLV